MIKVFESIFRMKSLISYEYNRRGYSGWDMPQIVIIVSIFTEESSVEYGHGHILIEYLL